MALEKNTIQQTEDVANPGLQVMSLIFFTFFHYAIKYPTETGTPDVLSL